MIPFVPKAMTPGNLGALLALLAVCLGSSTSARAGCVYPHVTSDMGVAHLDLLALNGALTTPEGQAPALPTSPCAGLRCSGDPAPPAPSPPIAAPRIDHWGFLSTPPSAAGPGLSLLARDDRLVRPRHLDLPLFRPPR